MLSLLAYSVSLDDGLDKLRAQFSRGAGPLTNSYSIDYSFFSPVKSENDRTKYPLVIIMAGALEGQYEGKELLANEFANWASEEYQNRFVFSGGAYILIARAPEERFVCWDAGVLIEPLKAALDDFIEKNPNVDTNRIYSIGWCLGAKGAINLTVSYPGFVDSVIIMVPPFSISDSTARQLTKTPVWLVGCKSDSYASYKRYIEPMWNELRKASNDPSKLRFTSFDSAPDGNIFLNHNVWLQFSHDMEYKGSEYSGMKTVDGNLNTVNTDFGCIFLLSLQGVKLPGIITEENNRCSCVCHKQNKILKAMWKILSLAAMLFNIKSLNVCKCGKSHW